MPCALLREHAVRYPGGGTLAALTAWVALLDLARGVRRSAAERRRARRARRNAPQIVPLSRVASTLSSLGTVSAHSSLARLADCTDSGNDESFHSRCELPSIQGSARVHVSEVSLWRAEAHHTPPSQTGGFPSLHLTPGMCNRTGQRGRWLRG